MEATLSTLGKLEEDKPGDGLPEVNMKQQEQIHNPEANSVVEAEKQVELVVNGLLEPLSEGEAEPSLLWYLEEQSTSSPEIYLGSLVSHATSKEPQSSMPSGAP